MCVLWNLSTPCRLTSFVAGIHWKGCRQINKKDFTNSISLTIHGSSESLPVSFMCVCSTLLWENPSTPHCHGLFLIICISNMVRFSAYNTDSSNTSDEEEDHISSREPRATGIAEPEPDAESDVDDEPSSSSSSSSEMQEEELLSSPPARRKYSGKQDRDAPVEDENDDIHFTHHVRVSPSSSSHSSPPSKTRLNNPRDDPTIIPWAKHVGVDAQTMHVMQTSLFRMPEEAAALKALQQAPKPMTTVRLDASARNQTVNRKHSRDSDGDGLKIDSREVGSFSTKTRAVY